MRICTGGSACFNTFTFWEGLRLSYYQALDRASSVQFQHLYLLGRSATAPTQGWTPVRVTLVSTPLPSGKVCDFDWTEVDHPLVNGFQHLYLLGRSATEVIPSAFGSLAAVSTPLPSGKVCDPLRQKMTRPGKFPSFNTFTFWEGLRQGRDFVLDGTGKTREFQHLYLLGRSATFWKPHYSGQIIKKFQHLYLLRRSATLLKRGGGLE